MESNRGVVVSLVHLRGLEDQLVINVIKLFFFVTEIEQHVIDAHAGKQLF